MHAHSLIISAIAVFAAPAFASAPQSLCVYGEVDSSLLAEVTAPVVDLRPSAIHQKVDRLNSQSLDDLYGYIRDLKGYWETPEEVWSKVATMIEVSNHGKTVCQVIYDKNNLYVALANNTGFLHRKLSDAEHDALDQRVPTVIYDLVVPSRPEVIFPPPEPEDS